MKTMSHIAWWLCAFGIGVPLMVCAQHPIEVERATASADYLNALVKFEQMPARIRTPDAIIAAARSAWALGLTARAQESFEEALRNKKVDGATRTQALLSGAIIEYQEGRYHLAIAKAEKAAQVCGECPLSARINYLWGQGLARLGSYGAADEQLSKALLRAAPDELPDMVFDRAVARLRLGKNDAAREDFERVPLGHDRAPDAIRSLALIALDNGESDAASFWLTKGREEFPDKFLDSWVDFALVQVALNEKDTVKAMTLAREASMKYPPSDPWLTLIDASVEGSSWMGGAHEK